MRNNSFSYEVIINNGIESENGRKIHLNFERRKKKGNYLYLHIIIMMIIKTTIMQVGVGVEERFFQKSKCTKLSL